MTPFEQTLNKIYKKYPTLAELCVFIHDNLLGTEGSPKNEFLALSFEDEIIPLEEFLLATNSPRLVNYCVSRLNVIKRLSLDLQEVVSASKMYSIMMILKFYKTQRLPHLEQHLEGKIEKDYMAVHGNEIGVADILNS